jgi:hypothetical protein
MAVGHRTRKQTNNQKESAMSTVYCKCGWRHEGIENHVAAEVIADRHESADIRRAYRHNTEIIKETK